MVEALTARAPRSPGEGVALHVLVGAPVRRVLDVLAPYCRRLRVDLALLGRAPGAVPDDDDVYRGLERLLATEPGCVAERRVGDDDEGFFDTGVGFVIDSVRLGEDLVDRRARGLVAPLKRKRAVIVGVVDGDALAALPTTPASVTVLASGSRQPSVLVDGGGTGVLPLGAAGVGRDERTEVGDDSDGAEARAPTASLSLPWRGLAPGGGSVDEGAFAAAQAAWRRTLTAGWPAPSVRIDDDPSALALAALASLVPATTIGRRR
jgi:hypothetical protein